MRREKMVHEASHSLLLAPNPQHMPMMLCLPHQYNEMAAWIRRDQGVKDTIYSPIFTS